MVKSEPMPFSNILLWKIISNELYIFMNRKRVFLRLKVSHGLVESLIGVLVWRVQYGMLASRKD